MLYTVLKIEEDPDRRAIGDQGLYMSRIRPEYSLAIRFFLACATSFSLKNCVFRFLQIS